MHGAAPNSQGPPSLQLRGDRPTGSCFSCAVASASVGRGALARIAARSAAKAFSTSGGCSPRMAATPAGCIAQRTAAQNSVLSAHCASGTRQRRSSPGTASGSGCRARARGAISAVSQ